MVLRRLDRRTAGVVVAFLAVVAGFLVGTLLVGAAAVGLRAAGIAVTPPLAVVLSVTLLQGIAFGSVSLAVLRLGDRDVEWLGVALPDARGVLWIVSGYVLAIVGALAVGSFAILAGLRPARNRIADIGAGQPEVFLLLVPLSFLLIGPGEELLFRGILQGSLREVMGPVPAIGIASVVFAAVHVLSLGGPLGGRAVTVGLLFIPAVVLGVAYERTRNLVVPALIHGAYNATLFTLVYVSIRFGPGNVA